MRGECTILRDIMTQIIDRAKKLASQIKNSSDKAKRFTFAGVAFVAIVASLMFTGTRIAYKIDLNGKYIATVGNKQQYDEALQLVVNMVDGANVKTAVSEPKFSTAFVLGDRINTTSEVATAIISNTDEIVEASTLYIDGKAVLTAEKSTIKNMTDSRLNSFNIAGQACSSKFLQSITTTDGYYLSSSLDDEEKVKSVVNTLSVVTEMRETNDVVVPYKSTVQTTKEQVIGYKKVSVSGVSGLNRVTQDVVMLNGEIQSTTTVSTQVVVAPVNEVIVQGIAKNEYTAQQKQEANQAGFIFPLPSGTWQVSSYYGDGRNHKGIDLRAPSGTPISAVSAGRVIHSGWKGDYGYCVIIEHPSGMRTLYAHARQVCCSVGDNVSQGEVIALVGTTGQSTGNHLHFEVITGGRKVNPAPYINLD